VKYKTFLSFLALPLLTVCVASGQGPDPERYIFVDVGTLGGNFSAAHGLNDRW